MILWILCFCLHASTQPILLTLNTFSLTSQFSFIKFCASHWFVMSSLDSNLPRLAVKNWEGTIYISIRWVMTIGGVPPNCSITWGICVWDLEINKPLVCPAFPTSHKGLYICRTWFPSWVSWRRHVNGCFQSGLRLWPCQMVYQPANR